MEEQILAMAKAAYNAASEQLPGFPPFDELPATLQQSWYMAALQTKILHEYPNVVNPIPDGSYSCSCAWGVTGGVIPGTPVDEVSKQWAIVSDEFHSPNGPNIFTWRMIEAMQHLQQLNNPSRLNWARLEWIRY